MSYLSNERRGLSGPQGRSAEAVKTFLDEIGPRWFPAKLESDRLIKLEMQGKDPGRCAWTSGFSSL